MFRGLTNALAGCLAAAALQAAAPAEAPATAQAHDVELRGRVVCLTEERAKSLGTDLPGDHPHQWGFKTVEGACYALARTKNTEAFFSDEEIRRRELIVRGRVDPGTGLLDCIPLRSVRDGRIYDLYYWCDICSIQSVAPGECMCCQSPVRLVERPLDP